MGEAGQALRYRERKQKKRNRERCRRVGGGKRRKEGRKAEYCREEEREKIGHVLNREREGGPEAG